MNGSWWEALKADFDNSPKHVTAELLKNELGFKGDSDAIYKMQRGEVPFKASYLEKWARLTGGKEFMRWAGSVTNHHVAPIPVGRVDDMQYADLMREFSEAVAAYTLATADGNVTPGEAVHVCKQLDDVIMASHRLKISINKRSQQRQGPRTMAEAERQTGGAA